jgi:hypothetical protein
MEITLNRELVMVAHLLRVDALAADTAAAFQEAGVPSVLLKGKTLADWLYGPDEMRTYGDADLLVPPSDWLQAQQILLELGFEPELDRLAHPRMESPTSYPFHRGEDHVDLHCTLWGIEATPEQTWETLSRETEPKQVGGRPLLVLAPAARAMHVALHAAQHGALNTKMTTDLERAIDQLPLDLWRAAASIATQLDATPAFATGLRMVPAGRVLASRMGLDGVRSVPAELKLSGTPLAQGFEHLASTSGLRTKLALIARELAPTPAFMRWWSPVARRGRAGLAAAYMWRAIWFARHAVPGYTAWRRARRATGAVAKAP